MRSPCAADLGSSPDMRINKKLNSTQVNDPHVAQFHCEIGHAGWHADKHEGRAGYRTSPSGGRSYDGMVVVSWQIFDKKKKAIYLV